MRSQAQRDATAKAARVSAQRRKAAAEQRAAAEHARSRRRWTVTVVEAYRQDVEVEAASEAEARAAYEDRGNIVRSVKLTPRIIAATIVRGGR